MSQTREPVAVSVVLASHNRPRLLEVATACFSRQRAGSIELIIVDDSIEPIRAIRQSVKVISVSPGTPLGDKLNLGFEAARGYVLTKWDDDDFYGPGHIERALNALHPRHVQVAFAQPFLIYDVKREELRRSDPERCSGATLAFRRCVWQKHPFRAVREAVDSEFLLDVIDEYGPRACRGVYHGFDFIQLRHSGHLWTRMPDGTSVEEYLERCELVRDDITSVVGPATTAIWRRAAAQ